MALNKVFLLPGIIFKLSLLESRSTLNHKTYTTNQRGQAISDKITNRKKNSDYLLLEDLWRLVVRFLIHRIFNFDRF